MNAWIVMVGIGAGSLAFRLLPQLVLDRFAAPPAVEASLRFAGPVALVALAVPVLAAAPEATGGLPAAVLVPRLLAVAVAAVVGIRTRSLPTAVLAGLPTFWLVHTVIT